jgi:cleavage stimulation factor subunit 1
VGPINPVNLNSLVNPVLNYKQIRYASQGNIYVSGSKDGSIKLWDGVTNKVINTIVKAHGGFEVYLALLVFCFNLLQVTSVQFSKNQKYLLSGGKDGTIRIWELGTGRQIQHIVSGPHWVW